jgi:hypothetical protein
MRDPTESQSPRRSKHRDRDRDRERCGTSWVDWIKLGLGTRLLWKLTNSAGLRWRHGRHLGIGYQWVEPSKAMGWSVNSWGSHKLNPKSSSLTAPDTIQIISNQIEGFRNHRFLYLPHITLHYYWILMVKLVILKPSLWAHLHRNTS